MTPERWQEVQEIFAEALDRRPSERASYLARVCADASLREQLERMIAAHEQGDSNFLESLAVRSNEELKSGAKIGPYEILALIGAGGMGEVYKAHDAKLRRDVAIKVLPLAFVSDRERLARCQREARLLASLNHPNIASIYGLEDSDGKPALIMELVEGLTLADRIRAGPIPIDEVLPLAKQICEALEYAHEQGIVHRDLKPANVKVSRDDTVKVLDFGLAKAFKGHEGSGNTANSPATSQSATEAGLLLGTAAYMSPEQAKGKVVDRRADIWAFGCVLYEMLTGKRAFRGETLIDTLSAVITAEPDWSSLPGATPMRVRVLLQRCLQKDAKQRLRDIGDARISLDEVLAGSPDAGQPATLQPAVLKWRRAVPWAIAAVLAVTTAYLTFMHFRQQAPPLDAMRFEIGLPEKLSPSAYFGLSPDGRELAFIGSGEDGQNRLWVRSFESLVVRPLDGTEGADDRPFWSPDSRSIGFLSQGKLKKIDASGGPPITLCDADGVWGGAWTKDNKIVFGSNLGIFIVDASGGKPSQITDGLSITPLLLPDGRHFIYFHYAGANVAGTGGVYLSSVDAKPGQRSRKLLGDYSVVAFVPSSDPAVWRLLFVRGATAARSLGTLMAQRFDTQRLELVGEAVPIAEQVPNLSFGASSDVIVYLAGFPGAAAPAGSRGNIRGQLTWFNRDGKILEAVGEPGTYRTLALSPDGKRVAFERVDPLSGSSREIWLYEFARGVTTQFTFDSSWDTAPVWSPDGSRIVFGSAKEGNFNLYQKASNLATEDAPLFKSSDNKLPSSWSPDGRFLLYYSPIPPVHIWLLPLGGAADRKPVRLDNSEFNEVYGRVSPDGRWIAYHSDESGRDEIYVRPVDVALLTGSSPVGVPPVTGKWMVSKGGGTAALWRRDGKELFYLGLDGSAMAVEVSSGESFQAGIPKVLFKVPQGVLFWDVSPDGKNFLMAAPSANTQPKFAVTLNWQAALEK